jgi:hypothetical protein
MPGSPPPGRQAFAAELNDFQRRITALEAWARTTLGFNPASLQFLVDIVREQQTVLDTIGASLAALGPVAIRFGAYNFPGNGATSIELPGIAHGLPTGFGLAYVKTITSLTSADLPWFADDAQYAAADTNFYLALELSPVISGDGSIEVSGGGSQTIDGNFLVSGSSTSGSGGVDGSSVITGAAILGEATFDPSTTYYFNWIAVGVS